MIKLCKIHDAEDPIYDVLLGELSTAYKHLNFERTMDHIVLTGASRLSSPSLGSQTSRYIFQRELKGFIRGYLIAAEDMHPNFIEELIYER